MHESTLTLAMNPYLIFLCVRGSSVSHDVYLINDVVPKPTWLLAVASM